MPTQDALRRLQWMQEDIQARWRRGEWPVLPYQSYPCAPCPGAPVMAIGLAQRELQQIPAAVDWLRQVFRDAGIERVHVTCIIEAAAGGRPLTAEETRAFLPYLRSEIVIVEPRVLAPMGSLATHIVMRDLRPDLPVFPLPSPHPGEDDPVFREEVRKLAKFLAEIE